MGSDGQYCGCQVQPLPSILKGSGLLLKNGCSSGDDQDKEHISQNWFTSKTDKQSLREQGHRWRQGQWTTEENEVLKRNIAFYCQVTELLLLLNTLAYDC